VTFQPESVIVNNWHLGTGHPLQFGDEITGIRGQKVTDLDSALKALEVPVEEVKRREEDGTSRNTDEKIEVTVRRGRSLGPKAFVAFYDLYDLSPTNAISRGSLLQESDADEARNSTEMKLLYHSEVMFCPREAFTDEDLRYLEALPDLSVPLKQDWRVAHKHIICSRLGYGGGSSSKPLSGVTADVVNLNFDNRAYGSARRFLMGLDVQLEAALVTSMVDTGSFNDWLPRETVISPLQFFHAQLSRNNRWSGSHYDVITNNCNAFVEYIFSCIVGMDIPSHVKGLDHTIAKWFGTHSASKCLK
jgi:hypothetical protein